MTRCQSASGLPGAEMIVGHAFIANQEDGIKTIFQPQISFATTSRFTTPARWLRRRSSWLSCALHNKEAAKPPTEIGEKIRRYMEEE